MQFAGAAEQFGLRYTRIANFADLRAALAIGGPAVVEIPGDRERNVALHEHVFDAVRRAAGAVAT